MLTIRIGLVASLATLLMASATASPLLPTADSYVRDGQYANTNYGSATSLVVKSSTSLGYNRDAYLAFDISGVTGTIQTATLSVYSASTVSTATSAGVYGVPGTAWGESTITWNNRPALGAQIAQMSVAGTAGTWRQVDVTSYAAAQVSAGAKKLAFALHVPSTTSNAVITAASRESAR